MTTPVNAKPLPLGFAGDQRYWEKMLDRALSRKASWRVVILCLCLDQLAFAQSSEDKIAADALFDAGREAFKAQDYESACPKFADSHKLDPGVGTVLNLARCYELWGKTSSAYSTYREAAALAHQEKQVERESFARAQVERLEKILTRLVIDVGDQQVEDLTIRRNGKVVRETMWGIALPVDPGTYTITVIAPGYETVKTTIDAYGKGKTIKIHLPSMSEASSHADWSTRDGHEASRPSSGDATVSSESNSASAQSTVADQADQKGKKGLGAGPWILGGLGVAAAGTATVFAFYGLSASNTAAGICLDPDEFCSPASQEQYRIARRVAYQNYTVAYIGWGVGGAAVIGSTIWLLVGGSKNDQPTATAAPMLGPGVIGITARGHF